jgi:hypothetical protein
MGITMKIEIDTEKATLRELDATINFLSALKDDLLSDEDVVSDASKLTELSDDSVLDVVVSMHKCALTLKDAEFKTTELYRKAIQGKWIDLSPNTRKAIGRRFKKLADEHWEAATDGDLVVEFTRRNIQKSSIYKTVAKVGL